MHEVERHPQHRLCQRTNDGWQVPQVVGNQGFSGCHWNETASPCFQAQVGFFARHPSARGEEWRDPSRRSLRSGPAPAILEEWIRDREARGWRRLALGFGFSGLILSLLALTFVLNY